MNDSDIVIIGGGAAGCVFAGRVARSTAASVTLLEAGKHHREVAQQDLRNALALPQRAPDWGYHSESHEGRQGRPLRRGKLLGGTGWFTRFAYRGTAPDYDPWGARVLGWGYDDVLPYLRRIERDLDFGKLPYHGNSGLLPVCRLREAAFLPVAETFFEALAANLPVVEDHNAPNAWGVGRLPLTSPNGVRRTTADAYLDPVPDNLTIRTESCADIIVFDGVRAVGVRLTDGSIVRGSWIVLCAGAYGSAMLLMRSGIGDANALHKLGIAVVVNNTNVGNQLADHAALLLSIPSDGAVRTEPMLHGAATFRSASASPSEAPDLMLWFPDEEADPPAFSIDVVLLRPASRGSVRLQSRDANDPPSIHLPGLRESADVERLCEALDRLRDTLRTRTFAKRLPSAAGIVPSAAVEVRKLVRASVRPLPHVSGTCAMSVDSDEGVVDARGYVFGTDRLMIADSSVIPHGPAAFTYFPVVMVAERIADCLVSDMARSSRL